MVPPTVEALLPLGEGKTCELGSMQLMIEPSRPLGFRKRENGVEHWHYQPDLLELVESAGFKEQLAGARRPFGRARKRIRLRIRSSPPPGRTRFG